MFSGNPNFDYVAPGLHPNDVISGRGNESIAYFHPGNVCFRNLVKDFRVEYVSCRKAEKPAIAKAIVGTIMSSNPPGRFMKKHKESGLWFDIGYRQALTKTRQALREGAPILAKRLKSHEGDLVPKIKDNNQQLQQQLQKNQLPPNLQQFEKEIQASDINLLQSKNINVANNQISRDLMGLPFSASIHGGVQKSILSPNPSYLRGALGQLEQHQAMPILHSQADGLLPLSLPGQYASMASHIDRDLLRIRQQGISTNSTRQETLQDVNDFSLAAFLPPNTTRLQQQEVSLLGNNANISLPGMRDVANISTQPQLEYVMTSAGLCAIDISSMKQKPLRQIPFDSGVHSQLVDPAMLQHNSIPIDGGGPRMPLSQLLTQEGAHLVGVPTTAPLAGNGLNLGIQQIQQTRYQPQCLTPPGTQDISRRSQLAASMIGLPSTQQPLTNIGRASSSSQNKSAMDALINLNSHSA